MPHDTIKRMAQLVAPEVGWKPPTDGEIFLTYVDGTLVYRGVNYEYAARSWDACTWQESHAGGVAIQQYQNGLCVRDGWLLHVTIENGVTDVYLNPTWHLGSGK